MNPSHGKAKRKLVPEWSMSWETIITTAWINVGKIEETEKWKRPVFGGEDLRQPH